MWNAPELVGVLVGVTLPPAGAAGIQMCHNWILRALLPVSVLADLNCTFKCS